MVIDGAINSTHDVFGVDESLFEMVFPKGTDVAFLDEVEVRVKDSGIDEEEFWNKLYSNIVDKKTIDGLHGILHSTGSYCKKEAFPSRIESETIKDRPL